MLDLHPYLMLFVLGLFLFLVYRLNTLLYQPLIRFMDNRDRTIAKDLKDANNLSSDSEELLAEAAQNIESAKAQAAKMRHEVIEQCKLENEKAILAKQAELDAEYEKFVQRLEEEKEALKGAILSQLPLIKESLKAKFSQI